MRPIDADKLFDRFLDMWGIDVDPEIASMFMDAVNNAPTITPPSNDPLTLEELREMSGEPVWFYCDFTKTHIWRVISLISQLMVYFTDGGSAIIKDYGDTWLAYRQKPGEDAT